MHRGVRGALAAWNTNALANVGGSGGLSTDDGITNTTGELHATTDTWEEGATDDWGGGGGGLSGGGHRRDGGGGTWQRSELRYPYEVNDTEAQDASSFQLQGSVRLAAHRSETGGRAGDGSDGGKLTWSAIVASQATYNRSTDASRVPHVERGEGTATFSSPSACVDQRLAAANGSFTTAHTSDGCPASKARRQLCEMYDQCGVPPPEMARRTAKVGERALLWRRRRQRV